MLLYSIILDISPALTKDNFIQLVIDWNQKDQHEENIIRDLRWNGERNIRFGSDCLWLDIEECPAHNIIAVRYEKQQDNGAVWDTDYIMNFGEMKMAVRLDRSYTEDAAMENLAFSTPHFLTLLIGKGYLKDDQDLSVTRDPYLITHDNLGILTGVISGERKYRLPIVYVSKTSLNADPLDCARLGSRLKGAAHVLLQSDISLNHAVRKACGDQGEYHGSVGIYYPNGRHRRFIDREYDEYNDILLEKVTSAVFQYDNAQKIPQLYTWDGVTNAIMREKWDSQKKMAAETTRQEAEAEVQKYMGEFDQENERLRTRLNELTRANYSLQQENQAMLARASAAPDTPVLVRGDEEDLYPGEIREMILDAISEKLKYCPPKSRRYDVYSDILQKNEKAQNRHQKSFQRLQDDDRSHPSGAHEPRVYHQGQGKALQAYLLRGQPLQNHGGEIRIGSPRREKRLRGNFDEHVLAADFPPSAADFQKTKKRSRTMITVYGMPTCVDCSYVDAQIEGNEKFRCVDIGAHVKNLKEFLRLRDTSPAFDDAKKNGYAGIPCFVLEDGTVTLKPEDVGLKSRPADGRACRIDGTGC